MKTFKKPSVPLRPVGQVSVADWPRKLFLSFFLVFALHLSAGEIPVFGPEKYTREAEKPQKITKSFAVQNLDGKFTLVVQNGEGTTGRVSSAVVELNGVRVVRPDAFTNEVDVIKMPVNLQQENKLTVEVRSEPGAFLSVSITRTAEPPSPIKDVTVEPDGFPVNVATQVRFTAAFSYQTEAVPTLELQQLAPNGEEIGVEGVMVDSGNLSLGDEIQGDRVFSFQKTYTIAQPDEILLRVKATETGQVSYSDTFKLLVFTPISDAEVTAMNTAQDSAEQLYQELLPTKGKTQALADAVAFLKAQSIVKDAGVTVAGIWITYTNDFEAGSSFNPPGTKGGASGSTAADNNAVLSINTAATSTLAGNVRVDSKKVLVLAPFLDEFGANDDGPAIAKIYETHNATVGCPKYDVVYLNNSQVDVAAFKTLGSYGIVHISSHGFFNDNYRLVVFTKTSASRANQQTYQSDLESGRLVIESINGRKWLAATPQFFTYYIKRFPNSLIFFSSCYSTFTDGMWKALQARGAQSYLGFSGLVSNSFAYTKATYFHKEWVEDPQNLVTTGDVFHPDCQIDFEDPFSICWELRGATNLEAPNEEPPPPTCAGLQNAGFEAGTLEAWSSDGDGRVVTQLGTFSPTEGSYMGIISTGLGFPTDSGSISQTVCIPVNATILSFDWNLISEKDCDPEAYLFRVDLTDENGVQWDILFDDGHFLCQFARGSGQGGQLPPLPFSSGQGEGTWSSDWQRYALDISPFAASNAGKPVTIRFSVVDVGNIHNDTTIDSAILLDDIQIRLCQ